MWGKIAMTTFVLLCLAVPAKAGTLRVEITATVLNAADITNGKLVSAFRPEQITYTSDGMMVDF